MLFCYSPPLPPQNPQRFNQVFPSPTPLLENDICPQKWTQNRSAMRALSRQPSAVTDSWLFLSCTLRLLAAMPARHVAMASTSRLLQGHLPSQTNIGQPPVGPRILKALLCRLVPHSLRHIDAKPEPDHNTRMPHSLWNRASSSPNLRAQNGPLL